MGCYSQMNTNRIAPPAEHSCVQNLRSIVTPYPALALHAAHIGPKYGKVGEC